MRTQDAIHDRPIIVVGPSGGAHTAMLDSLLAAPGTWDATAHLNDLLVGRPTAQSTGSLTTMVAVAPVDVDPAIVLEALPDARLVLLARHPTVIVAEAPDDAGPLASQYERIASTWLDLMATVPVDDWIAVTVEDLVMEPETHVQLVFARFGLGWHQSASRPWLAWATRQAQALARLTPAMSQQVRHLEPVLERLRAATTPATPSLKPTTPVGSLSARDQGLGEHLQHADCSLLVTTYQSNRVIALRHDEGALGVHLRAFDRPMGIARTAKGFALGVRSEVLDYRDFPALAARLEPAGRHDAAYVPRNSHVTGDVAVHDLGVGHDGLWLVSTTFNCLATLDLDHSIIPRWRPEFITAIVAEDRCHLNGLAMVDGRPKYVTALGVSDTAGGWRATKAHGGVIIDVDTQEIVASGLSMPHSPRWYDGRLWFLESGRGHLSTCAPATGEVTAVAELPGFTRGLRFNGTTAYVGTSQIRETATFGGLPIAERPERQCGVWAVDIASRQVVASVVFEDRIQEIFDLEVLGGVRFPEVVERDSDIARTAWLLPAQ